MVRRLPTIDAALTGASIWVLENLLDQLGVPASVSQFFVNMPGIGMLSDGARVELARNVARYSKKYGATAAVQALKKGPAYAGSVFRNMWPAVAAAPAPSRRKVYVPTVGGRKARAKYIDKWSRAMPPYRLRQLPFLNRILDGEFAPWTVAERKADMEKFYHKLEQTPAHPFGEFLGDVDPGKDVTLHETTPKVEQKLEKRVVGGYMHDNRVSTGHNKKMPRGKYHNYVLLFVQTFCS